MKNYFEMQKLQSMQEKEIERKINNIGDADINLQSHKLLQNLAITFFFMDLIIATISIIYRYNITDATSFRINAIILIFSALSLVSLISSISYKNKLCQQIDEYNKKYQ